MNKKKYVVLLSSILVLTSCSTATKTSNVENISISVESNLYGSAYTNGKSTLKKEYGVDVTYGEDSKALITLTSSDGKIDDSKIDSSNALVTLADGDAYDPDDFDFNGSALDGKWEDGTYTYFLSEGDIEPSNFGYEVDNGGNEWSALGSDGKGLYYFNLEVSGIKYDGKELEPITMRALVQIYGYDYTADAADLYEELPTIKNEFKELENTSEKDNEPTFTWIGEGDKPILCDANADNFYITWTDSINAKSLEAEDITITLRSEYSDELVLSPNTDYEIKNYDNSTQIGLNYQYWAFAPVYTTMEIDISKDALNGAEENITQTYDIGSVYVNLIQYGGGMDSEGTVIVQQTNGFDDDTTIENDGDIFYYILTTVIDGNDTYVSADKDGNLTFTSVRPNAKYYMSDAEHVEAEQIGNKLFFTEHNGETEQVEIDGKTYTCNKLYGALSTGDTSTRKLKDGYVWSENSTEHHKWAWQKGIEVGWTTINISPMKGRYTWSINKGESETFTSDVKNVTWSILGNSSNKTSVDDDGVLTIGSDETSASFALIVEDSAGNSGAITVYPR